MRNNFRWVRRPDEMGLTGSGYKGGQNQALQLAQRARNGLSGLVHTSLQRHAQRLFGG
jgi:hypothetical protein